jgi:hypothetical protein
VAVAVWSPQPEIRVLPAGGGAQRVLAACPEPTCGSRIPPPCEPPGRLDWSPDGTRIAFDARPQAGAGLVVRVVDVATGAISDVRSGSAPFWSPDGRLLGSIAGDGRIQIGAPSPGRVTTLPLGDVTAADWQSRH